MNERSYTSLLKSGTKIQTVEIRSLISLFFLMGGVYFPHLFKVQLNVSLPE